MYLDKYLAQLDNIKRGLIHWPEAFYNTNLGYLQCNKCHMHRDDLEDAWDFTWKLSRLKMHLCLPPVEDSIRRHIIAELCRDLYLKTMELKNLYNVLPIDEVVVFDIRNYTHDEEYQKRHGIDVIHLYPLDDGYYDIHRHDDFIVKKLNIKI